MAAASPSAVAVSMGFFISIYVCDEISKEESQVVYYITKMTYIKEG